MSENFRIERGSRPPISVLQVHGALSRLNVYELKNLATQAIKEGERQFVLDLRHVNAIDSAGVGAVNSLRQEVSAVSGRVALVEPQADMARRTLHLARMTQVIPTFGSDEDAVHHLRELLGLSEATAGAGDYGAPQLQRDMSTLIGKLSEIAERLERLEDRLGQ